MKTGFIHFLWLLVLLFLIAVSNYFVNKEIYEYHTSLSQVLIGNICLILLFYGLAVWVKKLNYRSIKCAVWLSLFLLLFITFSEFLIFRFSGVAFEEQTFLHFEIHSLLVGFTIYPVKYTAVVTSLLLISWLLVSWSPVKKTNRYNLVFFLITLLGAIYFAPGSSLGRLVINYYDFLTLQKLETLDASEIESLQPFGIQSVLPNNQLIEASFKSKKKNLIIVYIESFSRDFITNKKYPGLTPNITELISTYGELEDYQSTAKFTMQGLMSSICGLVPKLTAGNNISTDQLPYQSLSCLTDVLHKLEYYQEFMGGARKNFSNKEAFLKLKKYDQVYGWTDYDKPKGYLTNDWGLQDSDLFNFALDRAVKLNASDQPFHLSVLTLATHLNGNPDPACPKYEATKKVHKFIQGIHCADYLLGKFLQELESNKILEDTTVLITSDHGVFPVPLIEELFGKEFERNRLLGILIDDYEFDKSLPLALYDVPAILINALGIESNVTFINGRFPEEISPDRFLLREQVLNPSKSSVADCNIEHDIELPIDPCENRRLVKNSWRYAANFNGSSQRLNLNQGIQLNTVEVGKRERVEFVIDGVPQLSKFLVEGYPVTDLERKFKNHVFMLVYDIKKRKVVSRNAFNYEANHTDYFYRAIENYMGDDHLIFVFTEYSIWADSLPEWNEAFNSIGGELFNYPEQAYFAVFRKNYKQFEKAEFSSHESKPLNLAFESIRDIKLLPMEK